MTTFARAARRAATATLLAVVAGCASAGGQGAPGAAAATGDDPGAGPFLYAPNQDDATVSVIDVETLEVVRTVDLQALGFGPNAKPHHAVVEPDGSRWYLSLIGENTVLKLNRAGEIVGRASVEVPGMLALHPTEDVLFVGRSMSAVNPPRRIARIDRSTMEVDEIDVFFPRPHAIALGSGGELVYTASLAENSMAVVWPDDEALEVFDLPEPEGDHGGHPHTLVQFAVSPDGRWLVGTGEMTASLLVFDVSDPAAPRHATTLEVGARPWHPVFTRDGERLFFANKGTNEVTVVRTSDWSVLATVSGAFDAPHGSALSPDGSTLFISSNGTGGEPGSVTAIDVESLRVLATIPLGRNVAGLGAPSGS